MRLLTYKPYQLFFIAMTLLANSCNVPKNETTDNFTWEGDTPELQGISSQAILDFIETAERERPNEMHSFMLLRHGKEVASGWWDPYDPETPHMLYSLSKSFASTAIGIAQAEGLLSIDDQVISFFPEDTPDSVSQNLQSMRIRDLLKMNSGHNQEPRSATTQHSESWVKGFLSAEVEHKPGTHFVYNSMATFMLSAIITKVSGERLRDYLMPRLFEPLGIEEPRWDQNANGIDFGGWGLYLKTEDIAKFGQLLLQKGEWEGQQLVPAAWVEEATSYQTSNGSDPESDWEQGYGYQFWMCRHGQYRGDGAFGQYCIVFPEQEAVMAITSGTSDMGAVMNLVWDYILPAFEEKPLEANGSAYQALQGKTASLQLDRIEGDENAQLAEELSGKEFALEENDWALESITFNLTGDTKSMTFATADQTYELPIGYNRYADGDFSFPNSGPQTVATSGAWIEGDTLELMMYLDESPHAYMAKVYMDGDRVKMEREMNVFFGPTKQADLVGAAIE